MRVQIMDKLNVELKDISIGTTINHKGRLLFKTDDYDTREDTVLCVELTTGETQWLPADTPVEEVVVKILAYTDYNTLYAESRE